MSRFAQLVEITTSRWDEILTLADALRAERAAAPPEAHALRIITTADRHDPTRFIAFLEFATFDDARYNSTLEGTQRFWQQVAPLCDKPLRFTNLDVLEHYEPQH